MQKFTRFPDNLPFSRVFTPAFLAAALWMSSPALATQIHVPADHPTIQAAISAAQNGDEIIVAAGTYNEAINLEGKAITLRSDAGAASTIIDASGLDASVATFNSGEGSATLLKGFTLTGGTGTNVDGVTVGGGILADQFSSPTIVNCIIRNNTAQIGAATVHLDFSSPLFINTLIVENTATFQGGGASHFVDSNPTYINCTFANNHAPFGSAIDIATFCHPTLINCIIWGNTHDFPETHFSGFPHVRDSIVQDGYVDGENIIVADPLFIDAAAGDYRLTNGSPAIDAGSNEDVPAVPGADTDLDGNPRIADGTGDGNAIVDLGAYEFQPAPTNPADLDGNGVVDVFDLLLLLSLWGSCADCGDCPADFDGNCAVDVFDLLFLLANWG